MNHDQPGGTPLLSEFADDPEMVELVELFVAEMPMKVTSLRKAFDEQSLTDLTRLAHQLKGAAAGYGFPTIGEVASELEGAAKATEDVSRLRAQLDELLDLCNRASMAA